MGVLASASDFAQGGVRAPMPVQLLYALLAVGFVIYIPVALLRSNALLLLQDLLLWLAFLSTVAVRSPTRRAFGGDLAVSACVVVYLIGVAISLTVDRPYDPASTVQGLRSLLFGAMVLYLSSVWLCTMERARTVVIIFVLASIFVAVYGFRQLVFGLLPFEAERVALMGASAAEVEQLGRLRVPSAFGDPATFSFSMMLGVFFYLIARHMGWVGWWTRRLHPVSLGCLLIGLGMTLTRAPMLGLAVGVAWFFIAFNRINLRLARRLLFIAMAGAMAIFGLNHVATTGMLQDSEIGWVRTTDNILSSVWTLLPNVFTGEVSEQLDRLRTTSANSRMDAWHEGLQFLLNRPFGGGVGAITEGVHGLISFAPVDVGFLRFGLEAGIVTMAAVMALVVAVFVAGWRKWRRVNDHQIRAMGACLLGAWLAIAVAQSVTSFAHTEVIGVMVWVVAGLLLNLDRIANSRSEAMVAFSGGNR